MSANSPTSLITYAPVINRHGTVVGAHFRVHAHALAVADVASALNALSAVWTAPDCLALIELIGTDASAWIDGWSPRSGTVLITDNTSIASTSGYVALGDEAPKLCVRSDAGGREQAVGYQLVAPDQLAGVAGQVIGDQSWPVYASEVESLVDQVKAVSFGAEFIGGWSAKHKVVARPSNQRLGTIANVLKLMEVVDRDGAFSEIETIFKRDAVLSYKLVSLANSAALGLSVEVTSLQHALSMIGMARLRRWLAVLLANCGDESTPPALLQTAMVRALFLESIGKALDMQSGRDDLFLLGTFSLLDKILGMPLVEILLHVSVSEPIMDALVHRYGAYSGLLQMAEAVENADDKRLRTLCDELAMDGRVANRALIQAIRDSHLLMQA